MPEEKPWEKYNKPSGEGKPWETYSQKQSQPYKDAFTSVNEELYSRGQDGDKVEEAIEFIPQLFG